MKQTKLSVMSLMVSLVLPAMMHTEIEHQRIDGQELFSNKQTSLKVSYNRYQAGFACRENGWEFCENWAFRRGRLA